MIEYAYINMDGGMSAMGCEQCAYYTYDEDSDSYFCEVNLDEDEMSRFMSGSIDSCPYFRLDDEYGVVRKQN